MNTEKGKADELKELTNVKASKRGKKGETNTRKGQKNGDKIMTKISTTLSTVTKRVNKFLRPSATVPLIRRPQQTCTATTGAHGLIPSNQPQNQQTDPATQDGRGSKKPPD